MVLPKVKNGFVIDFGNRVFKRSNLETESNKYVGKPTKARVYFIGEDYSGEPLPKDTRVVMDVRALIFKGNPEETDFEPQLQVIKYAEVVYRTPNGVWDRFISYDSRANALFELQGNVGRFMIVKGEQVPVPEEERVPRKSRLTTFIPPRFRDLLIEEHYGSQLVDLEAKLGISG